MKKQKSQQRAVKTRAAVPQKGSETRLYEWAQGQLARPALSQDWDATRTTAFLHLYERLRRVASSKKINLVGLATLRHRFGLLDLGDIDAIAAMALLPNHVLSKPILPKTPLAITPGTLNVLTPPSKLLNTEALYAV